MSAGQSLLMRFLSEPSAPSVTLGRSACLAEDVFDLAENAAIVLVVVAFFRLHLLLGQGRRQLLEQLLLLLRQLLRRDRMNGHEQVAAAAAGHVGHALAAQAERGS